MGQHGRAVSLYLLNGSVTGVIKLYIAKLDWRCL